MQWELMLVALLQWHCASADCTPEDVAVWRGKHGFSNELGRFARSSLGFGKSTVDKLVKKYPLSQVCAACFEGLIDCGRSNCKWKCMLDAFAPKCIDCNTTYCKPQFITCTAVVQPNDLPLLPQTDAEEAKFLLETEAAARLAAASTTTPSPVEEEPVIVREGDAYIMMSLADFLDPPPTTPDPTEAQDLLEWIPVEGVEMEEEPLQVFETVDEPEWLQVDKVVAPATL